jgi:hypothetical protein
LELCWCCACCGYVVQGFTSRQCVNIYACLTDDCRCCCRVQNLFVAASVCKAWRRLGLRMFWNQPWESPSAICHPVQLFGLVSLPPPSGTTPVAKYPFEYCPAPVLKCQKRQLPSVYTAPMPGCTPASAGFQATPSGPSLLQRAAAAHALPQSPRPMEGGLLKCCVRREALTGRLGSTRFTLLLCTSAPPHTPVKFLMAALQNSR